MNRPTTQRGTETRARINESRRRLHRELFFAHNGPGPYDCFHCHTEVDFSSVTVHHVDDDHDNNAIENLVPMHNGCHRQYHATKRVGVKRGPNKKKYPTPEGAVPWNG